MLRITIKQKLIALIFLIIFSIIGLLLLNQYSIYSLSKLDKIRLNIAQIESGMLMLRRNEKDFLARNDLKYQDKFTKNFASLKNKIDELISDLAAENYDTEASTFLAEHLNKYSAIFLKVVDIQKKIGMHSKDGLYGALRKAVHTVEDKLKSLDNQHLRADMLQLRRNEKDFMLRLDMKYPKKLQKNFEVMLKDLYASQHSGIDKDIIHKLLEKYRADFMELVKESKSKGLTPKSGLMGEMRNTVHKTENILNDMSENLDASIFGKVDTLSTLINVLSVLFLGVIIGALLWFSISILRSIGSLSKTMQQIAFDKDISRRSDIKTNDELGDMANAFNSMLDQFESIIEQVSSSSSQLAVACEEVSAITVKTSQSMNEQQSQTEQVATAMNQMSATVQEVSKNITSTAQAAQKANMETTEGYKVVQAAVQAIQQLAGKLEVASDVVSQLEHDSEEINKVLDVIKGVAEQTNLLALNAAIEAARAGEQGRGFAVVADEVRTLAGRTQESTEEINQVIEKLQTGSRNAAEVMGMSHKEAQAVTEQAILAGESLSAISTAVVGINDMSAQIASAAEQQSVTTEEINRNIVQIMEMSNETSSDSRQVAAATEDLTNLVSVLQGLVAQFRA